MQILFIVPRPPFPPLKGDQLRAYHLIKALSPKHQIDLCFFYQNRQALKNVRVMRRYCRRIEAVYLPNWRGRLNAMLSLINRQPFQVNYYRSGEMAEKILQLSDKNYQAVYLLTSRMAPYGKYFPVGKLVLDQIDALWLHFRQRSKAESNPFKKLFFSLEASFLRRFDRRLQDKTAARIVVSDLEISDLEEKNISVVPIGVDGRHFYPAKAAFQDIDLIFLGNMDYYPNIKAVIFFCQKVLPDLLKSFPRLKFYIVGANPSFCVRRLADKKNIFVTGWVKDIRGYLSRSKIMVAPLKVASGIQRKVLKAMASGVPVVSTSLVNRAIGAKNGQEIILADEPGELVKKISHLLQDEKQRKFLARNARRLVVKNFKWSEQTQKVERILKKL